LILQLVSELSFHFQFPLLGLTYTTYTHHTPPPFLSIPSFGLVREHLDSLEEKEELSIPSFGLDNEVLDYLSGWVFLSIPSFGLVKLWLIKQILRQ